VAVSRPVPLWFDCLNHQDAWSAYSALLRNSGIRLEMAAHPSSIRLHVLSLWIEVPTSLTVRAYSLPPFRLFPSSFDRGDFGPRPPGRHDQRGWPRGILL